MDIKRVAEQPLAANKEPRVSKPSQRICDEV